MTKNFFIVEDHSLMRHGITKWITENSKWECSGSAENITTALENLLELKSSGNFPAIIITDINLNSESDNYLGIKLIEEVKQINSTVKYICYSMYKSPGIIQMALNAGALGYISKNADETELLECMEQVFLGNKYIEKTLVQSVVTYNSEISSLTKREQSVLNLIIQHKANVEIALILGVQKRAIETYISRLYDKTGCANRQELIDMFNK